ncbi:Yip1 family protein [Streptomyces sp. bgisy153]|uniref:Yip1 family protein n=1 Tax=Streptomyces sp. bgisy153 TaxID=3413793 RepID=UPI003D7499D0
MAGFRIGRGGRDDRAPQARPQHPPHGQQAPQAPSYGYPPTPQAPQPAYPQYRGGGQPPYGGGYGGSYGGPGGPGGQGPTGGQGAHGAPGGHGGHSGHGAPGADEPEYFGGDNAHAPHAPQDRYAANNPGHTQAFSIDDQAPYGRGGGPGAPGFPQGYDGGRQGYTQGETYQTGAAGPAAPIGPRLRWKELLRGIVLSPAQTFLQMRDYTMWGPALIVTFLYGLLAVFGFDGAREEAIDATLSSLVPIVLMTAVAMVLSSFVLGVVTHTLARQLGGNGAWQPTVGLSMLIMSLTDAPRLLFAMFLGGDATFVQGVGWVTWAAAGTLLTMMVSRSHDLPWPKALGASAIQLIALVSIVKLGTF